METKKISKAAQAGRNDADVYLADSTLDHQRDGHEGVPRGDWEALFASGACTPSEGLLNACNESELAEWLGVPPCDEVNEDGEETVGGKRWFAAVDEYDKAYLARVREELEKLDAAE